VLVVPSLCAGSTITLCWQYHQFVLTVPSLCAGSTITLCWYYHHFVLAVPSLCAGSTITLCWQYHHFLLAVPSLCAGSTITLCWQYHQFVLVVPSLINTASSVGDYEREYIAMFAAVYRSIHDWLDPAAKCVVVRIDTSRCTMLHTCVNAMLDFNSVYTFNAWASLPCSQNMSSTSRG